MYGTKSVKEINRGKKRQAMRGRRMRAESGRTKGSAENMREMQKTGFKTKNAYMGKLVYPSLVSLSCFVTNADAKISMNTF